MNNGHGPALVILAAGLGSRYGGYKQLDTFGPDSETIMDLSIIDAITAGFQKIILVINREIATRIRETVVLKYKDRVNVECVFQELHSLPAGFKQPAERIKPWGTGHAVLAAEGPADTPFAVINADDFYGSSAFLQIKNELDSMAVNSNEFCMLGYRLKNTLSRHGGVSRGICKTTNGYLSSIMETKNIRKAKSSIIGEVGGESIELKPDAIASMNIWGFSPAVFPVLNEKFITFLNDSDLTSEFFITDAFDDLIAERRIKVKVLITSEKWYGVTYSEDREEVRKGIQEYLDLKEASG